MVGGAQLLAKARTEGHRLQQFAAAIMPQCLVSMT
jgi:hypothetical protein